MGFTYMWGSWSLLAQVLVGRRHLDMKASQNCSKGGLLEPSLSAVISGGHARMPFLRTTQYTLS